MMAMDLTTVPIAVLVGVHEKWDWILKNGWDKDSWMLCAMCKWLDDSGKSYEDCPLFPEYCAYGEEDESRIHVRYGGYRGTTTWEQTVEKLLAEIQDEIERGKTKK